MNRHRAAFTLVELLVAAAVSSVLSGIIYAVGSEAITAFARNISINRSYSDARLALERLANTMQSAGNVPVLLDSNGLVVTGGPAAGVRFYRYAPYPTYQIPSGSSATTTLAVNICSGQTVPYVGDLAAISQLGFQGTITAINCTLLPGATNTNNPAQAPVPATLSFATTISAGCYPALTAPQDFTVTAGSPAVSPPVPGNTFSCQIFSQVAFIAVPPAGGVSTGSTQLRYYRQAMSASTGGTACGSLTAFNSPTVFNNTANYKVVASLPYNGTPAQLQPFQLPSSSMAMLNAILCAEGPDYSKRNLHTANTFTQMQSTLCSRSPVLLTHGQY